jgi:fucose 4-O-acetylase-like acetyltransferase
MKGTASKSDGHIQGDRHIAGRGRTFHGGFQPRDLYVPHADVLFRRRIFAAAVAALALSWVFRLNMDIAKADYGVPVASLAGALAVILGTIAVSDFIARRMRFAGAALALCGKASMMIMYLHHAINSVLATYAGMHQILTFLLAILIPIALFALCDRFAWTRKVVLGADKPVNLFTFAK